jgi:Ca-activated chloride channel family protein
LLILSDGEDNAGELTGLDAARMAAANGIKIYTVGLTPDLDADGAAILRSMADAAGGAFFPAQSVAALSEISQTLDRIEPSAAQTEQERLVRDWTAIPLALTLLALGGLALWRKDD